MNTDIDEKTTRKFDAWWKREVHDPGLPEEIEREVKFYAALAYRAGRRSHK